MAPRCSSGRSCSCPVLVAITTLSASDDDEMTHQLTSGRLLLRRWKDADLAPFAALNADPIVMEHLPAMLSRAESDAFVARIEAHFDADDFGLFAVEVRATGEFIGFVGLWTADFDAPFTPAVEVGWRLRARPGGMATQPRQPALRCATGSSGWDWTRSCRSRPR